MQSRRIVGVWLCVALLVSGLLHEAAPVVADSTSKPAFTFVGQAGYYVKALAARGNYLYVASGRRLLILDASDPTNLQVVGQTEAFGADIDTMALAWPYVYLTWWEDPPETYRYQVVSIVDVSTASAPVVVGRVNTTIDWHTLGIAAAGRYAYVAREDAIWLVDATDVHAPELPWLGRLDRKSSRLAASGNLLCVGGTTTLDVYDYSDPHAPALAGQCVTPYAPQHIVIVGERAYVADGGLAAIDLSDPTVPALMGYLETPHTAKQVAVSGNYACAIDDTGWLMIVNISNPQTPTLLGEFQTSPASAVALVGNRVYLTTSDGGISIVSIAQPSAPAVLATYTPTSGQALAVADGYAYTAGGDGLTVFDVSDPARPVAQGNCAVESNWGWDVAVEGDHAYVVTSSGLTVVDVADPEAPSAVGQYPTKRWSLAVTARDNLVYMLSQSGGLLIIDVSAPYSPTLVSTCSMSCGDYAGDLVLVGNTLYVPGGDSALTIVDVTNPAAPAILGQYSTAYGVRGVAVVGNLAYVQDLFNGVYVLDVSDPTAPTQLGRVSIGVQPRGIAVLGNYLYVIFSDISVKALDISTPESPQLLSDCQWDGSPYDIKADGDYLYVAEGSLTVLRLGDQTTYNLSLPCLRAGQEPATPVSVQVVNQIAWSTLTGTPTGVDTGGPYWYRPVTTGYGTGYLDILSMADPTTPTLVGRYTAPNNSSIHAWAQLGDHLYVAPGYGAIMYLVDISNAAAPSTLASWDAGDIVNITLTDTHLLAITWDSNYQNNYLKVYSLADPTSPVEVGSCRIGSREEVSRINVMGDVAWVNATDWRSNYYGEITAIDISDLMHPQKLGTCFVEGYGLNPAFSDGHAYVGSGRRNAFTTVDISDASAPRVADHLPLPGNSGDAVLWGPFACTSAGDYLAIIDLDDPATPVLRSLWNPGVSVSPVMAVGDYLYASTDDDLLILQLGDASQPAL